MIIKKRNNCHKDLFIYFTYVHNLTGMLFEKEDEIKINMK